MGFSDEKDKRSGTLGQRLPELGSADEREVLLGFIMWKREQVVETTAGLDEAQLRWTPDGRLLPIIGVIFHLTHMEERWVGSRYHGDPYPARVEEFQLGAAPTGPEAIEAYWQRGLRTNEIVRAAPSLDAPAVNEPPGFPPAHERLGLARPIDLRWVLYHVLEETSHHAGHADATREMLDGARMTD